MIVMIGASGSGGVLVLLVTGMTGVTGVTGVSGASTISTSVANRTPFVTAAGCSAAAMRCSKECQMSGLGR